MSTPADDAKKEPDLRVATSSGFSVRQTEEAISMLRRENFNLKLKMFHLESRSSNARPSTVPSGNDVGDKEFCDLFAENEAMRNELDKKQRLLKAALDVIQTLEDGKLKSEQRRDMMIEQRDLPKVNNDSNELFQLKETSDASGGVSHEVCRVSDGDKAEGREFRAFRESGATSRGKLEARRGKVDP